MEKAVQDYAGDAASVRFKAHSDSLGLSCAEASGVSVGVVVKLLDRMLDLRQRGRADPVRGIESVRFTHFNLTVAS